MSIPLPLLNYRLAASVFAFGGQFRREQLTQDVDQLSLERRYCQ